MATLAFQVLALPVIFGLAVVYPPTVAIGRPGWIVLGAFGAASIVVSAIVRVVRGPRAFDVMLAAAYFMNGWLAVTMWLAGGWSSPFHELYLGSILLVSLIHPLRRGLPFACLAFALTLTPLAYAPVDGRLADVLVADGVWVITVLFCSRVMGMLRAQRMLLVEGEREATGLAHRDALTGLENRRSFDAALGVAILRARTTGEAVAVAVGDVDDFKQINDRHGHLAGDRCLDAIADALVAASRVGDRIFRWGGDEFAVLLVGPAASEASAVCDRLEGEVAGAVATPDGRPVTVTFGWAFDGGAREPDELLAAADAALLERKRRRPRAAA